MRTSPLIWAEKQMDELMYKYQRCRDSCWFQRLNSVSVIYIFARLAVRKFAPLVKASILERNWTDWAISGPLFAGLAVRKFRVVRGALIRKESDQKPITQAFIRPGRLTVVNQIVLKIAVIINQSNSSYGFPADATDGAILDSTDGPIKFIMAD